MPIINVPSLFSGTGGVTGLGDINPQFYFSTKSGELIWGVGPTFTLPTATDKLLGNGKFSMAPTAVVVTMQGPWVAGVLANNQWSVAGWGKNNVNSFLIEPFVNYNLPDHWYLSSAPVMTANWAAKGSDVWTVPLGGGVGKLFRLGHPPSEYLAHAELALSSRGCAFRHQDLCDFTAAFADSLQIQLALLHGVANRDVGRKVIQTFGCFHFCLVSSLRRAASRSTFAVLKALSKPLASG